MTIKECFDFVDEVKPNYFSNERKLQWINEVEGLVQTKVSAYSTGRCYKLYH